MNRAPIFESITDFRGDTRRGRRQESTFERLNANGDRAINVQNQSREDLPGPAFSVR